MPRGERRGDAAEVRVVIDERRCLDRGESLAGGPTRGPRTAAEIEQGARPEAGGAGDELRERRLDGCVGRGHPAQGVGEGIGLARHGGRGAALPVPGGERGGALRQPGATQVLCQGMAARLQVGGERQGSASEKSCGSAQGSGRVRRPSTMIE